MALTDDLVAWYNCETAGASLEDVHGSNSLSPKYGTPYATTGKVNLGIGALSGEYWRSGSTPAGLQISGSFTMNFWFRWNAEGVSSPYLLYQSAGMYIRMAASTKQLSWYTRDNVGGYDTLSSTQNLTSQNTWYMLTFQYNTINKQKEIYINAIQRGSKIAPHGNTLATPISYYYSWYMYSGWTGLFDERGVWSRFLGTDDRSALWNSGNGVTYDDLSGSEATGAMTMSDGSVASIMERYKFKSATVAGPNAAVSSVMQREGTPDLNPRYVIPQPATRRYFGFDKGRKR